MNRCWLLGDLSAFQMHRSELAFLPLLFTLCKLIPLLNVKWWFKIKEMKNQIFHQIKIFVHVHLTIIQRGAAWKRDQVQAPSILWTHYVSSPLR